MKRNVAKDDVFAGVTSQLTELRQYWAKTEDSQFIDGVLGSAMYYSTCAAADLRSYKLLAGLVSGLYQLADSARSVDPKKAAMTARVLVAIYSAHGEHADAEQFIRNLPESVATLMHRI